VATIKQFIYIFLFIVFFFFSCTNEKPAESLNSSDSLNTNQADSASDTLAKNAKIFALPAPLQIPTMLKNSEVIFSENVLVSSKKGRTFSSDYLRALNLGIYTVDVGCAAVYNQKQSALNYYRTIAQLLNDLNLASNISINHLKRFEKNFDKPDSTCSIILESYNVWQNYFQENKREEIGLYIMAGSYIESLYLSLNSKKLVQSQFFPSIIGQQKLFLDNILELSNYIDKHPDFDDLYLKLGSLQELFLEIEVVLKNNGSNESIVTSKYTPGQLSILLSKVSEVRSSIIK